MLQDTMGQGSPAAGVDLNAARDLLARLLPQVKALYSAYRAAPATVDVARYAQVLKLLERALAVCERHLDADSRTNLRRSLQAQVWMLGLDTHFAVADAPRGVNIQLTNRCNLRCIMCHHDQLRVPTRDMPVERARQVLDQCAEMGVGSVCLQNFGESFLYRRLPEVIEHGVDRGLEVTVVSNGTAMPMRMARAVVEAGLRKIVFSVEGYSAERYESIRVGARFERVHRNIARLRRVRDELGGALSIELHTELYEEGEEFQRAYREFWAPLADTFSFARLTPFPGIEYLDREGARVRFGGEPTYAASPCLFPFRFMVIKANGDVVPCCVDQNHDLVMGNAFEQGLGEIWRSDTYGELRKAARAAEYGHFELCRRCPTMASGASVQRVPSTS
jgi:radical SAM protein with 4Fe4S-binding SPASM domain